jgi:hypothetical protein
VNTASQAGGEGGFDENDRVAIRGTSPSLTQTTINGHAVGIFTGVTEPIEFTFMFLAPALYAVHALLTGIAFIIMNAVHVRLGFNFSAALFDYALNFKGATRPLWLLPVGAAQFAVYYVLFRFAIVHFDLKTPGREPGDTPAETAPVAPAAKAVAWIAALGGQLVGEIPRYGVPGLLSRKFPRHTRSQPLRHSSRAGRLPHKHRAARSCRTRGARTARSSVSALRLRAPDRGSGSSGAGCGAAGAVDTDASGAMTGAFKRGPIGPVSIFFCSRFRVRSTKYALQTKRRGLVARLTGHRKPKTRTAEGMEDAHSYTTCRRDRHDW